MENFQPRVDVPCEMPCLLTHIPLLAPAEVDVGLLATEATQQALSAEDEDEEEASASDDPFNNLPSEPVATDADGGGILEVNEDENEAPYTEKLGNEPIAAPAVGGGQVEANTKRKSRQAAGDSSLQFGPKKRKVDAKVASAERRRIRRAKEADARRNIRLKVKVKYANSAVPLQTDLMSEELPTTKPSYEAKVETIPDSERDNFKSALKSKPETRAGSKSSLQSANGTLSAQGNESPVISSPQPNKSTESLNGIVDPGVRGVLERMMREEGFAYKAWDASVSHPVLDAHKRVPVVLVGKPGGDFDDSVKRAFKEMETLAASELFSHSETDHVRGQFPAINVGISMGPGGKKPMRVSVHGHDAMMERLLNNEDVKRLASHQDASFKFWEPRLYAHYDSMMTKLLRGKPGLRKNFRRSVFSSMAFNFPPSVRTHRHRDVRNLPYGLCAIHALGDFDPKAGGHIILWELKLIIEFPPGAMVLIPSATITHSNVPVAPGQKRASITQYTGGSLFRHVDNGFKTDAALKEENATAFAAHAALRLGRWEKGLEMWSKVVDGKLL